MRHILRILQALLGIAFAVAGFTKLFMTARMISIAVPPWITSYPELGVSFFGLLELAGGLVLIRQAMLEGLRSRLAFRAALLLASVMLVAVTTHGLRGDLQNIPANAFLLLMCALVAGRHRPVSKHARLANQ